MKEIKIMISDCEVEKQQPYAFWLHRIPGIGNKKIMNILNKNVLPKEIYTMEKNVRREFLKKVDKISGRDIGNLEKAAECCKPEYEYDKIKEKGIKFYPYYHKMYPKKLKNIPDFPFAIYVLGKLPDINRKTIAVIGARECSAYGQYIAKKIGIEMGSNRIQVISGLARGIDGIATDAAFLAKGTAFAVLGSGVDVCYPSANSYIYQKLLLQGGIISEFPPGTNPLSRHFPMRNRIISGLSDAVVVVEAREKSGTLITVDMALEQGRDVYAIPGRVTDTLSVGCNRLIYEGAAMILNLDEFIKEMKAEETAPKKEKSYVNHSDEHMLLSCETKLQKKILDIVDFYPQTMQEIYETLSEVIKNQAEIAWIDGHPTLTNVRNTMFELEKSGKVSCVGGYYSKVTG